MSNAHFNTFQMMHSVEETTRTPSFDVDCLMRRLKSCYTLDQYFEDHCFVLNLLCAPKFSSQINFMDFIFKIVCSYLNVMFSR